MAYIHINGKTVPAGEAVVSIHDRGFRYGDGLFETIAVHGGRPWRLAQHLARLASGLAAVRISCDTGPLTQQCLSLLEHNKVKEGMLRIQITRGSGRGYLPDANAEPTVVIETLPPPERPKEPVSLWLSSYQKIPLESLPVHYKLSQGMNGTLARMEAADHGCFDALQVNISGELCETTSANLFWLEDDVLYTPALSCGVMRGVARGEVIRLSPYPVREVAAGMATLAGADAVFITNAVWKAMPVAHILPETSHYDSVSAARYFYDALMQDALE